MLLMRTCHVHLNHALSLLDHITNQILIVFANLYWLCQMIGLEAIADFGFVVNKAALGWSFNFLRKRLI